MVPSHGSGANPQGGTKITEVLNYAYLQLAACLVQCIASLERLCAGLRKSLSAALESIISPSSPARSPTTLSFYPPQPALLAATTPSILGFHPIANCTGDNEITARCKDSSKLGRGLPLPS